MFEDVNVVWAMAAGVVALVLGPASGVWVGMRGIVSQIKQDRIETREWLKALQTETSQNTTDIAVIDERTRGTSDRT